jgi:hypothetical protein
MSHAFVGAKTLTEKKNYQTTETPKNDLPSQLGQDL